MLCADVFGVAFFRKHASWPHLLKLFPWVVIGVVAGYFALDKISNAQVQRLIGGIILVMVVIIVLRILKMRKKAREQNPFFGT